MNMRRVLSCVLLPAHLSSCVINWEVQRASPGQVVKEEQPSQIRVTMTDHSEIVLDKPSGVASPWPTARSCCHRPMTNANSRARVATLCAGSR